MWKTLGAMAFLVEPKLFVFACFMLGAAAHAAPPAPPSPRPYVAQLLAKVRAGTVDTESERDHVKPEDVAHLAQAYLASTKWKEKALLVELVQDSKDAALAPVMWDALDVPDCSDDTCWWVRAVALAWLDGDLGQFSKYYEDRKACRAALDRRLKERAKRKR